ncbi:FAD-dependent oxidoreductase [Mesorhizobium australicum]|uniref:FAD-dependent oxidoreductase n=1 Tax=Mesorhizobium australicum TaxID=536018 RepID=UPI00333A9A1E
MTVLEARRIAWGTSGRNGGFVSPGWAARGDQIRKHVGTDDAKMLFRLSMEGVAMVSDAIRDRARATAIARLRLSVFCGTAAGSALPLFK